MAAKSGIRQKQYTDASKSRDAIETIGTTAATSAISATADKPEIIGTTTATPCTVKKRLATFPSPARMSLTKLSLGGNNLIISTQGEFGM